MKNKEVENLKKDIQRLALWQDKIINELDNLSKVNHAYYSSFSLDARAELEKENPDLFKKEDGG